MIIGGRKAPRAIVFIDEIEKQMSGSGGGDLSGVTDDQHMQFLTEMQNKKAEGMILVGHPGSAKSMFAKAFGNTAGIVTIQMDVGAMKGSLQGESEKHVRQAFKVIDAVSQGKALYIATCNKISGLSPELKRRFTLGTFFFDLPTLEERTAIWKHYVKKYDLKVKGIREGVEDEGWTGADIENCCKRAWMFNCSLGDAAKYATPICKTNPQGIEALRHVADNAFISANYEGLYQHGKQTVSLGDAGKRKMTFK
jgi:SpoVK/Ycf46/Vps4 family AAA+-type ATPase